MASNDKISHMIPTCVVLDTNVCLDLFVFHDPLWIKLLDALRSGAVKAVTRHDCRMEWLAVLNYPHLPLDPDSRIKCADEFDALISCLNPAPRSCFHLPICSDKDDQKFLELAHEALATFLITKDKALLKLSRKTTNAGLFRIIQPQEWPGINGN